jgi:DNA-directed RNA polymerase specialized sigma24 family protein
MRDTFVKAFRHLGQFRRDARFTTWLTRIAVNAAIEKRKTRKNFVPLSESENADEQFLPKHFAPWKSNPEQVFGKQEQMLGIVRDTEPFLVPLAVSARLYSRLERIFSDT